MHCQPSAGSADPRLQAETVYRGLLEVLEAEGATFGSVISESIFLRNLPSDVDAVREARQRLLTSDGAQPPWTATTCIEQPPLQDGVSLEVSLQVLMPHDGPLRRDVVVVEPDCRCIECTNARGMRVNLGDEVRFQAAGLCGAGTNAYDQTLGMFGHAERLLQRAGLEFADVVRTWIYLRDIDRDYGELNRARRAFFAARGIDPVPASTGIGGGLVAGGHDLCLGVYAVKSAGRRIARTVMTSPTLNEAPQYGADFVRGMRVEESNKVALLVSGTASIDEHGRTAYVDDFDSQADRMLLNIAALLQRQGATFGDIVAATTYLKHPADVERLRAKLATSGFAGFPHALVAAQVCRADLLCETEALAVLPR